MRLLKRLSELVFPRIVMTELDAEALRQQGVKVPRESVQKAYEEGETEK